MPDQDDKKRASLRGRGWDIMRGPRDANDAANNESVEPTTEETSELFAIGGSIGLDEPSEVIVDDSNIPPLPMDFTEYELELVAVDDEPVAPAPPSSATPVSDSWDWLEGSQDETYDDPPYNRETLEMPTSLQTEELNAESTLYSSLGIDDTDYEPELVIEEETFDAGVQVAQASDTAAFQAFTNRPVVKSPAPIMEEPLVAFEDSSVFDGTMNLGDLDNNLDELNQDLATTLKTGASQAFYPPQQTKRTNIEVVEAIPQVETNAPEPIRLQGQVKLSEVEDLIPTEPESVAEDPVVTPPIPRRTKRTASEGVGFQPSAAAANTGLPTVDIGPVRPSRDDVYRSMPPAPAPAFDDSMPTTLPETYSGEEDYSDEEAGGGAIDLDDVIDVSEAGLVDSPFDDDARLPSSELFYLTENADPDILSKFVDDESLQAMWSAIENLQAEVANKPWLTRKRADTYQAELLEASDLLLQSRENYDDARAVVYRIRGDLARDERAMKEIEQYAPALRRTIGFWFLVVLVAGFLSSLAEQALRSSNNHFLASAYLPVLFGIAGGAFLAYSTLNRHTTILRDFDSSHASWYRYAPFVGALMGFLVYVLWVATLVTSTSQDVDNLDELQYPAVLWILAFLGGLQQNWVIGRLRALRDRGSSR